MPSIHSLLPQLKKDYPSFHFQPGVDFLWSPNQQIIFYDKRADDQWTILIHELAHGLLRHTHYIKDIQLIRMERQAWETASDIAGNYNFVIEDDVIEAHLDSYRDWLHSRSTCPECLAVGVQVKRYEYFCLACHHTWRVNEARTCALRRYRTI